MNSNPVLGLLGFWMLMQLVVTLALVIGGIYALFCLGRASAGLERMADALEEWVAQHGEPSTPTTPPVLTPLAQRFTPVTTAEPVIPPSVESSTSDESHSR